MESKIKDQTEESHHQLDTPPRSIKHEDYVDYKSPTT